MFNRLLMEPPFRVVTRAILKYLPTSVRTKAKWELSNRPSYMMGVVAAVDQARREGINRISVIEFGVAGGNGLLELQRISKLVQEETGIDIDVYGFDMGSGLPSFVGDHKDHPDMWKPGDFVMDVPSLQKKLDKFTTLMLGPVKKTFKTYLERFNFAPVGFVSFDMDLYSSTRDALKLFSDPRLKTLNHTPMYFDDIEFMFNYKDAGEFKAINEFNEENKDKYCIDKWYGIKEGRPFPERGFLDRMYVFHNCVQISTASLKRDNVKLELVN